MEKYIVTATGIKGNEPYSMLSRIVTGVKDNGDRYTFIDNKSSTIREAEEMKFGAILEYQTTRVVPKAEQSFNINGNKPKE